MEPAQPWRVVIVASAQKGLARLPTKAAVACLEFCTGPLVHDPARVGKPLGDELRRYHAARRGPYRVVYQIVGETRTVKVVRIEHRLDVYRPR